jgi:hypothetical protein
MGYELDALLPAFPVDGEDEGPSEALARRWQLANERLAEALGACRALRGRCRFDDPRWLAAQMRVAWARQRCREACDALERCQGSARDTPLRR